MYVQMYVFINNKKERGRGFEGKQKKFVEDWMEKRERRNVIQLLSQK